MSQENRISGGQIDRTKTWRFSFDGVSYQGHPGDTLASALLANGVRLMGRSFKYHRPRGPLSAGSEEPNALVQLRSGARQEPNTRATAAELFDGLEATSQNAWPSLKFDAMAINDRLNTFFTAGFYYKTFMWPAAFWEKVYEPIIRRAAGLGALTRQEDPDEYDKGFLHCDLVVIGAGPAGLSAALTAGRAGARVILADEDFRFGGRLNAETLEVGGQPGADWAAAAVAELGSMPNVRLMLRTTIIGAFDHGIYGAVERVSDHLAVPAKGKPRQTLWRIYSRRAVLAGGAIERPIAFENNDRPGVMLAGSLRAYANRWGVAVGRRAAVFTNNDDGLRTAADLKAKGIEVRVIDGQECAGADLAIAELIVVVLKALCSGRWVSTYLQRAWSEHDLMPLFLQVIKDGGNASLVNRDYLLMFGLMKQEQMSAQKLWQHLFVELYGDLSESCRMHIAHILEHGCLAGRILRHTGKSPDHATLARVYRTLATCLAEDRILQ